MSYVEKSTFLYENRLITVIFVNLDLIFDSGTKKLNQLQSVPFSLPSFSLLSLFYIFLAGIECDANRGLQLRRRGSSIPRRRQGLCPHWSSSLSFFLLFFLFDLFVIV